MAPAPAPQPLADFVRIAASDLQDQFTILLNLVEHDEEARIALNNCVRIADTMSTMGRKR